MTHHYSSVKLKILTIINKKLEQPQKSLHVFTAGSFFISYEYDLFFERETKCHISDLHLTLTVIRI